MAQDRSSVESANLPRWNDSSDVVKLDANSVAGTAEDLVSELVANGADMSGVATLLFCNTSAVNFYLRTATLTAAGAGKGIVVPPGDRLALPYSPDSTALLYECAAETHVALFYA